MTTTTTLTPVHVRSIDDTPTDARLRTMLHAANAEALLVAITREVQRRSDATVDALQRVDWSDVGDMAHVAEELTQLAAFLRIETTNAPTR